MVETLLVSYIDCCWRHFQVHFCEWKCCILIKISLKFFPKVPIDNNPALGKIMAGRRIYTNDESIHWRIYATLWGNELICNFNLLSTVAYEHIYVAMYSLDNIHAYLVTLYLQYRYCQRIFLDCEWEGNVRAIYSHEIKWAPFKLTLYHFEWLCCYEPTISMACLVLLNTLLDAMACRRSNL